MSLYHTFDRCLLLAFVAIADGSAGSRPVVQPTSRSSVAVPIIHDSAGVRIVEYPTLAPPVPWFVVGASPSFLNASGIPPLGFFADSTPFFDIGGTDSDVELQDPYFSSAIPLRTGGWVVADKNRLVWLNQRGRTIGVTGRAGRGPGEFEQILGLCALAGDTVLAIDHLGTSTLWTDTRHIRTIPQRDPLIENSCDGRGHLVAMSRPRITRIDLSGAERRSEHWLVRSTGDRVASLGRLPAPVSAGIILWQPAMAWAANELVVARGRAFELEWRYRDGRVRQIMRFTRAIEKITDAQWRKVAADAIPAGSTPDNRKRVLELLGPKPLAAFPPHGPILIDPIYRVWVSDYVNPAAWTVFTQSGELLGRLELRSGLGSRRPAIIAVGTDFIQVREQDEDGFTHIRFYRLRRRT